MFVVLTSYLMISKNISIKTNGPVALCLSFLKGAYSIK